MRLTLTALALACCVLLGCVDARSEEQPAAEEGPITEAFKDLQRLSALQARLDSNVARISSYVQSSAPEDDLAQRSPSEGFTQQLLQDLIDVRVELLKIGKSLNVTMGDIVAAGMEMRKREEAISELKEQEQEFIVREALREGQVQVDYETGKVKAIEREDGEPETTIEEMVIEADPAMLHLDLELLQDVAVLALATSFIGAGVSFLSLPPMLGYLTAGMLVGPSCLNLITKVVEVETLAQFGSMFILFSRGLTYSSYYLSMQSTPQQPSVQATWAGVALIAISIVGWMAFTLFFELAGTLTQAFVTALCFSLSATSWVIDVISKSHVQGTRFGQVVLEMCRVQDLGMVPMLVAPAIIRHMFLDFSLLEVIRLLSLQIFGVLGIVAISRAIFPKLLSFMLQAKGSVATPFTTTTATTTSPHHNDTPTRAQSTPSSNRSYTADRTQHLFKRIVDHEHPAPEASAVALPAGEHTPDAALFAVIAYCTGLSLLTEWMELSHDIGGLFAGLVLLDAPHIQHAASSIDPLTSFFGGLYLASIGMITSPLFVLEHMLPIAGGIIAILLLKFVACFLVMRCAFHFDEARCAAVSVGWCNISEVGMFVCARAYRLDLISRRTYLITLASTVVCFFVAPFVSQKVLDLIYTFDNSRKEAATSTATAAASGASSPSPGSSPDIEVARPGSREHADVHARRKTVTATNKPTTKPAR